MDQQQRKPGGSVMISALALIMALAAFAAAFWYFDGMTYVDEYLLGISSSDAGTGRTSGRGVEATTTPGSTEPTDTLVMPEGMTQAFALRVWQEQLDSQAVISRLAEGRVKEMAITRVVTSSVDATLQVMVTFSDGSRGPGVFGLRRIGSDWYFSHVTSTRSSSTTGYASSVSVNDGGRPDGPLPNLDDVDIALLNTILVQQKASSRIIGEYVAGKVMRIVAESPRKGSHTITVPIVMYEDHETATADLILIEDSSGDEPRWFIARFSKTGSVPLKK